MEEVVATIFLGRLNSLLHEESEIFGGLEDEILLLKSQLSHLNSHIQPFRRKLFEIGYFMDGFAYVYAILNGATSKILSIELKESIHNWLVRFRETIHDADDCIDLFIFRMNNSKDGLDDSDQIVAAALLGCELRIINECFVEILDAKSQLDTSIASLSIERSAIIDDEGENFFIQKFNSLPIDLKSCFMYSGYYLHYWHADKDKLVELLMAEGLIEEIPGGERMEDIVEGNINKLIELGLVHVQNQYLTIDDEYWYIIGDEYFPLYDKYTNIPLNIRHASISFHDSSEIASFRENIHISSIRSLSIDLFMNSHVNSLENFFNLKLLRVLELECYDYKCNIIPDEVGNLIHLRYLYLNFQNLEKLPESISNLRNLQTLKIECPKLKELPSGILNLLQLRHLKIKRYRFGQKRTLALIEIERLTNLQTLSGLYVGDGIASELSNLTQIRQLGIAYLMEEDASELYASITKMTGLLSLSLSATGSQANLFLHNEEDFLPSLEPFSPPPLLQKLHLAGCLQEMPDWLSSMKNLTRLVLTHSNLLENPASLLDSLPNLKFLKLQEAYKARYIGREFCRSGGFPTLETLIIYSESLIEWTELEQGSFPSLKFLCFQCPNLTTLPEGLQLITTLQKLHVGYLHGDLARKLSPDGGPENYKIEHIPIISQYGWHPIECRDDIGH